jgi:hypothetical protein
MKTGQVFVSHTSDMARFPAGRSFVQAAMDGVGRAGLAAVDMRYFAARDEMPSEYCRARVAQCEIYVAVVGFRYGSLVKGEEISYTELEFQAASSAGLPRLVFLLEADEPPGPTDEDRAMAEGFRQRLMDAGLVVRTFTTSDGLELEVFQALSELTSNGPRSAPPVIQILPRDLTAFVGRDTEPQRLIAAADSSSVVAIHPVFRPTEARSAYLQQVRRIAPLDPPGLVGREAELAELAGFCTEPDRGPYVWWQAGPWAGKSALLSTFVLHPPSGVRVVSFFITARLAAQDTREAFAQVLLEQLADLTRQDLPPVLPEVTRDAYLLDLLALAAETAREAGGRLVLVVDGLDEDRGVTTGPNASSIAGMLPADPPAGMRVIVAGRPDPPIPDDVPDWHPLRDAGIIRVLDVSPHARDLRRLSRQELQGLLDGTPVEQDLLGVLTAARGGLSGPDLEELTGAPLWEIEKILHRVAGRTFTRRGSQLKPGTGPDVYLLGHEELHAAALRYLGHSLRSYHDRLHGWADTYRAQGWPTGTPEYLLTGYYRLLVTLEDMTRMAGCAGDLARHDRMLDITGGDAAALAEIRTTLDLIVTQQVPDVASALRLACHRDLLTERNTNIPVALPSVWASLGQVTRAEALAFSIVHPERQSQALVELVGALAGAGQHQQAETLARAIPGADWQAQGLARVAGALAGAGQYQQAETLARAIPDHYWQSAALAQVAGVLARAGQYQHAEAAARQAETIARSISDPDRQTQVVGALAEAGQYQHAEALSRSIGHPYRQAAALAQVARALAGAGQGQQAETAALLIADPYRQASALAQIACALARAGRHEQAEAAAHSISYPGWQAEVLGVLAKVRHHQKAKTLAWAIPDPDWQAEAIKTLAGAGQYEQAETLAWEIPDPFQQVEALAEVVGALGRAGHHQQAETLARAIPDPFRQAEALAKVAGALARAGQHQQAEAAARQAETAARSITDSCGQAKVAGALAAAEQYQQAETLARAIPDPLRQAEALAEVAGALARAGQHEQAEAVARHAEAVARSIIDLDRQAVALARASGGLAAAEDYQQAETLARAIHHPYLRAQALTQVAETLAYTGHHERAAAVIRAIEDPELQAEALAEVAWAEARADQHKQDEAAARHAAAVIRAIEDPELQAEALAEVAWAEARAGQHQQASAAAGQAEVTSNSISDRYRQAQVLVDVAGALAEAEQYEQAVAIAGQAKIVAGSITDPGWQAHALARISIALARAGQYEQAEALAREIPDQDWQAESLVEIAAGLTRTGDFSSARRVAASICTVGQWTTSVAPVLRLDPSAFASLIYILEDRWRLNLSK